MSINLSLSKLEFGSLFTYSPRGLSASERQSKIMMMAIKNDLHLSKPSIAVSEFISDNIKSKMKTLPFSYFFETNPILVPVPKSTLMRLGTLWVPHRIALALHQKGLGKAVENLLLRRTPLHKSATSTPQNRPKATDHYNSLDVQKRLSEPREILLVDDIVTRDATLLGAADRLTATFPGVHIRAFAAMRTISPPDIFNKIIDPSNGEITLIGQDTYRRP
jgi:hypothetical protein